MHHVLLVVAFVALALVFTMTELHIRRRLRQFRRVQLFCYSSSYLGAMANASCLLHDPPEAFRHWSVLLGVACVAAQILLLMRGWTRSRLPMRALPAESTQ